MGIAPVERDKLAAKTVPKTHGNVSRHPPLHLLVSTRYMISDTSAIQLIQPGLCPRPSAPARTQQSTSDAPRASKQSDQKRKEMLAPSPRNRAHHAPRTTAPGPQRARPIARRAHKHVMRIEPKPAGDQCLLLMTGFRLQVLMRWSLCDKGLPTGLLRERAGNRTWTRSTITPSFSRQRRPSQTRSETCQEGGAGAAVGNATQWVAAHHITRASSTTVMLRKTHR